MMIFDTRKLKFYAFDEQIIEYVTSHLLAIFGIKRNRNSERRTTILQRVTTQMRVHVA